MEPGIGVCLNGVKQRDNCGRLLWSYPLRECGYLKACVVQRAEEGGFLCRSERCRLTVYYLSLYPLIEPLARLSEVVAATEQGIFIPIKPIALPSASITMHSVTASSVTI